MLATHDRSNAFSLAKSGGLGKTPWVKANSRTKTPITVSKIDSTEKHAATAGKLDRRIELLQRNSLITSPPRAGTRLLKPTAAT